MKNIVTYSQTLPSDEEASLARASAEELSHLLGKKQKNDRAHIKMDGQDLIMPRSAILFLRDILTEMAQGNAINIVPIHHLLTTQEAANLLNVSRPYLIQLLSKKEIPFSKVGTHRRIRFIDLIEYKTKRDQESEKLLDELVREAEENDMGY